jgi:hypothetical protein
MPLQFPDNPSQISVPLLESVRKMHLRYAPLIAATFLLLAIIQPILRLAGLKPATRCAAYFIGSKKSGRVTRSDPEVERMGWLIGAGCRRWLFRTTCLERSLVTLIVLGRQDIPATLVMGFRRHKKEVHGHAWIEVNARPLLEPDGLVPTYSHKVLLDCRFDGATAPTVKP